jgi:hypothetical protein
MSTIRMEMWKKKKIEKNKEKCRKYYEKKREEGTNAKNRKCHCGYSETPAAMKMRKQRQDKAEKRLNETERKRKYRNKFKTNSQTTPINDLENSFSNRMQKSRAVQSVKQALPTTPKKRVAVMASYLSNKHSPTVKSLEKLNCVVSPEDKTNTQLGNAVINDIRELVDQTKNSRSDCARTTGLGNYLK